MTLKPIMVLFLSTGNAARSIMAEAILNSKGSDRVVARSAGLKPLAGVHPEALALLKSAGIEPCGLHTKCWKEFLQAATLVPIDVIVTLSEEAKETCPAYWPGNPVRVHWAVDDPLSAERSDVREWKFRKCYMTLEARINSLVKSRLSPIPEELFMKFKDLGMVV